MMIKRLLQLRICMQSKWWDMMLNYSRVKDFRLKLLSMNLKCLELKLAKLEIY